MCCVATCGSCWQPASLYGTERMMNSVQQRSLLNRNSAPLMRRITPLHIAAAMGYAPVAEVLLSFGADASSKNSKGCDQRVGECRVCMLCRLVACLFVACCPSHGVRCMLSVARCLLRVATCAVTEHTVGFGWLDCASRTVVRRVSSAELRYRRPWPVA
jgi:hypothetical protein